MNINYKRCIIITSYIDGLIKDCIDINCDDYIICADGGYNLAEAEKIMPNLVIGDFDSFKGHIPISIETIRTTPEKDDTDTLLCLKTGIQRGFNDFIICGGIGGRLDHTIANIQCLSYAIDNKIRLWINSKNDKVAMIEDMQIKLSSCQKYKKEGYKISLFSYTENCTGVCIQGVYYPLINADLKSNFPLGVSNEFIEDTITISNTTGKLLIILSRE
ncbi:thiamine diphosphokinase [Anaerovorax odorimutans]|uniref:thiamine diphosphokinase n=1 Tax=Anaerovorax odorimutans TaxID=109327 RepID=UPI000405CDE1|nr:thiamine diphosphokinase [Anaerovorax odorimutans]